MEYSKKSDKKLIPKSNQIQISSKRDAGFYIFLSKLFFLDYPEIQLHALGEATGIAVKVAEILTSGGFTQITKIQTTTLDSSQEETTPTEGRPIRRGKKVKIIINLGKSDRFDELMKNFKIQKA